MDPSESSHTDSLNFSINLVNLSEYNDCNNDRNIDLRDFDYNFIVQFRVINYKHNNDHHYSLRSI